MAGRKIRFDFIGDVSSLRDSLRDVEQEAGSLGDELEDAFQKKGAKGVLDLAKETVKAHPALAALATAAAAVGAAFVYAAHEALELGLRADEIAKKAKQIGSSAEDIQVLSGALEMGGVDAATAEAAMAKLNLRLAEAAAGGGPAVDVLKELGLNAKALQDLPLPERFAVLADRFQTLDTQGQKTAAAMKLMEEGGMRLLSAFEGGGDAIRDSSEKIREAGVISNETAAQGEGLSDAVAMMTRKFDDLKTGALAPLIPVISTTIDKIGEMFTLISESFVVRFLADSVAFVAEKFLGLTNEVEAFKQATSAMGKAASLTDKFIIKFGDGVSSATAAITEQGNRIKELNNEIKFMGALGRDTARYERELEQAEVDLAAARVDLGEQTMLLNRWETHRAKMAKKSADAADAAATAERALEADRAKAAAEEAKRQARADKWAADRVANLAAAAAATDDWASATRQADRERLEGLERIDAEEEKLLLETARRGDELISAAGLSAVQREQLGTALVERLEAIEAEYHKKRLDFVEEQDDAEQAAYEASLERAQEHADEKGEVDEEYYDGAEDRASAHSDFMRGQWSSDMAEVREWVGKITAMHNQLWDVIGQVAQDALDEWQDQYGETTARIAEIDEELQGSITDGRRRQLEREKVRLEEASEIEKEQMLQAFERQKALSIVQATIATALAAISALTTQPIVVGIIMAALATAAGVAAIAAIASQQPPQLHSGGMIPPGISGSAVAQDEVMLVARRGEAVLSPKGVAAAGGEAGVTALNRGHGDAGGGQTVNLIRVGTRTTEAIVHDALRINSSALSRAFGGVRPRVGRHDPRGRKV